MAPINEFLNDINRRQEIKVTDYEQVPSDANFNGDSDGDGDMEWVADTDGDGFMDTVFELVSNIF
jgi:hypothetical protein